METNGPVLTTVFYGWFCRLKDIGCTAADAARLQEDLNLQAA